MMVRAPLGIFLVLLAPACATPSQQQFLLGDTTYSLVTGSELRSAIVGRKVRYPDPQKMGSIVFANSIRCDAFLPNGRYVTCGHRFTRPEGTYEIQNDRICIELYSRTHCLELYRSDDGDRLLRQASEGALPEPIDLVAISDKSVQPE